MARLTTLAPRLACLRTTRQSISASVRMRGSGLQRERQRLMQANPLCVECYKQGIIRAWTQRDHIIPLCEGGEDTVRNTQGLCDECHAAKSALEETNRRGGGSSL